MATIKPEQLRVMVDANILIAGTGWPRFSYEVLQHAAVGDFSLVLSSFVIDEARKHIIRLVPSEAKQFDEFLESCGYETVPNPSRNEVDAHRDLIRDPNDVPVALSAINAQVDYLITQDKDFTDHDESTQELHQRLNIILPGTFLRECMGWTSEELAVIHKRNWDDLSSSSA